MPRTDITAIMRRAADGDSEAANDLLRVLYGHLKELARRHRRGERADHTLNTTALVNEAYLRLADQRQPDWRNRAHFLAIASKAMRRILIDHARARLADKRGGGKAPVTLNEEYCPVPQQADDLVNLDHALRELAELNDRQGRIVECLFFGGLTHEETAEVLHVSVATVGRDWRLARAWLSNRLRQLGERDGK